MSFFYTVRVDTKVRDRMYQPPSLWSCVRKTEISVKSYWRNMTDKYHNRIQITVSKIESWEKYYYQ